MTNDKLCSFRKKLKTIAFLSGGINSFLRVLLISVYRQGGLLGVLYQECYNYCFRNKCMSFGSVFALVPGIKEP